MFRIRAMSRLSFYLRREWLTLILGMALIGLLLNCWRGPLGPEDLLILRQHHARLTAERDRLIADNGNMRRDISRLQTDDLYLQSVIREELGYVRPGEIVYRFPRSDRR
jgi:cell division protein FtsB